MGDDLHRDVGGLLARVDALEKVVEKQNEKIDEVLKILHEARGGWRVFVIIGTVSAALGGFIVSFVDRLPGIKSILKR